MTLADIAKANGMGIEVINLGIGEPDFDTPHHIKDAAIHAIRDGYTKYTPVEGYAFLRQAIVDKFHRENGLTFSPKEVMASCGGKHSIYNFLQAILSPGDEVIVPAPFWPSFLDMISLSDGVPVIAMCGMETDYKLTPELLERHITPRTRAVIINSPSNPSGAVYHADELLALSEVLERHPDIWVMSDDMYEHITLDDFRFVNILNVRPDFRRRTVIFNGVSKAYAMTGWRIGYLAAPEKLVAVMANLQSQNTSNPTSISQVAASTALNAGTASIRPMVDAFRQRYKFLDANLNGYMGIRSAPSQGAFYMFANVESAMRHLHDQGKIPAMSDQAFCSYLCFTAGVAVVPGSAFGVENHVRISFATSLKHLDAAVTAIHKALR